MRITRRDLLAALPASLAAAPVALAQPPADTARVTDAIRSSAGRARLSMLFAGSTPAECGAWQTEFRRTLQRLLGPSRPPKHFGVKQEARVRLADHTRYELLLQAPGIASVPVYLLVPSDWKPGQKRAAVLAVHGHGDFGHHPVVGRTDLDGVTAAIKRAHYDYGLQFVRRGYVVAAPCMIPFGRRVDKHKYGGTDPCATTFVRMQALGQLSLTANLRDLRWTLDLLSSRPEVDGSRLGCAGLSYGGRMTMMVSAIDRRIKVAAVSGALNLLQERIRGRYSCGSQIIPGLLEYGDYSEIGSLIAPRPAVWETGSTDGLIVKKWDEVFRNRLRKAYRALGVAENLLFDRFAGGHRWNGKMAYPLFEKVLRG
ncbi:MAG TPA: hypothetical protein DCE47_11970 [Planctomycetaceae bacterium]|nr:hypothetical protein [Planctomycetaceae bacterium]HCD03109.1 hypothetical protein [Planctomycetaceae bacterium]|tara:strand:+ start:2378 stop:3487 length:1110 start_codon:yes stop_codon:yes gene_type:complete